MRLGIARWFNKVKVNAKSPDLGGTRGWWGCEPPHHLIYPGQMNQKASVSGRVRCLRCMSLLFPCHRCISSQGPCSWHFSPRLQSQKKALIDDDKVCMYEYLIYSRIVLSSGRYGGTRTYNICCSLAFANSQVKYLESDGGINGTYFKFSIHFHPENQHALHYLPYLICHTLIQ